MPDTNNTTEWYRCVLEVYGCTILPKQKTRAMDLYIHDKG